MLDDKKGLSLIVGVVILAAIAVTMAGIIFTWSGGFLRGLSPPVDCSQIGFEAEIYNDGHGGYSLGVVNTADIPFDGLVIKFVGNGESVIKRDVNIDIQPGVTQEVPLDFIDSYNVGDKYLVVPKITVRDSNGTNIIRPCDDKSGYETQYRKVIV